MNLKSITRQPTDVLLFIIKWELLNYKMKYHSYQEKNINIINFVFIEIFTLYCF